MAEPSWGFECEAHEFRRVVETALALDVDRRLPEPQWVGYWSFPMRDPMGCTVEVSAVDCDAWESPRESPGTSTIA